jgi:chromosome segregation ATPase
LLTTVERRIKENKSKRDATEKQIERLQQMIAKNQADIKKVENMAIERMQNKKKCEARILELNAKEDEIKVILSQDEEEVRKSKEKIEEAKSQCENARREERNAMENHKFAES